MLVESEHRSRVSPAPLPLSEEPAHELPPWSAILAMIAVLALLAATLISVCFLVAKLVTGHAI